MEDILVIAVHKTNNPGRTFGREVIQGKFRGGEKRGGWSMQV